MIEMESDDEEFPPNQQSIGGRFPSLEWLPYWELAPLSTPFGGIKTYRKLAEEAFNFEQGPKIGTCWFDSANAGVCRSPSDLKQLVDIHDKDPTSKKRFKMKLRHFGRRKRLIVDYKLVRHYQHPYFLRHKGKSCHQNFLQKGMAKKFGGYGELDKGGTFVEACHYLKDGFGLSNDVDSSSDKEVLKTLVEAELNGKLIGLGSRKVKARRNDDDSDDDSDEEEMNAVEEAFHKVLPAILSRHCFLHIKTIVVKVRVSKKETKVDAVIIVRDPHRQKIRKEGSVTPANKRIWRLLKDIVKQEIRELTKDDGVMAFMLSELRAKFDVIDIYSKAPAIPERALQCYPVEVKNQETHCLIFYNESVLEIGVPPAPYYIYVPARKKCHISSTFCQSDQRPNGLGYLAWGMKLYELDEVDSKPTREELTNKVPLIHQMRQRSVEVVVEHWTSGDQEKTSYAVLPIVNSKKRRTKYAHITYVFIDHKEEKMDPKLLESYEHGVLARVAEGMPQN